MAAAYGPVRAWRAAENREPACSRARRARPQTPQIRQPACKPGSVWLGAVNPGRDGHSSGASVAGRLEQPTRATRPGDRPRGACAPRIAPIRSCSRRGLPCRRRCRPRGALLPHLFTLTARPLLRVLGRRFALCGAVPGVAPAGRYPAPCLRGARTFLRSKATAVRPTGARANRRGRRAGQATAAATRPLRRCGARRRGWGRGRCRRPARRGCVRGSWPGTARDRRWRGCRRDCIPARRPRRRRR